jgi:hypothetical protein
MRESNEIDYGRLGPDIVLQVADVHCNLGIALKSIGQEEEATEALLAGWDRKHNKEQECALFQAFVVSTINCISLTDAFACREKDK